MPEPQYINRIYIIYFMLFCACVFFSVGHVHIHGICACHTIHTYPFNFHLYHILRTGGILSQFWSIGINLQEVRSNGVKRWEFNQSMDNMTLFKV